MKNFLHSKSFRLLIGVVVVLIGLLIFTQNSNGFFISDVIGFLSSPFQKTSSSVSNSIHNAVTADSEETLEKELERLRAENQQYRKELTDYYDYKQQVEQYKQILGIREKNIDLTMLAASVIAKDPLDLFGSFSIDLGKLDGIMLNDPVITGDGLVGWISKVYKTTAVVTTIHSPKTNIGATSKKRIETGIIQCDIVLKDEGLVKLAYLKTDTALKEGDIITTTGLSGIFPRNIIIGKVVSVEQNLANVSKYAYVRPYMDISELTEVFVVTDFYGKGKISSSSKGLTQAEE